MCVSIKPLHLHSFALQRPFSLCSRLVSAGGRARAKEVMTLIIKETLFVHQEAACVVLCRNRTCDGQKKTHVWVSEIDVSTGLVRITTLLLLKMHRYDTKIDIRTHIRQYSRLGISNNGPIYGNIQF